MSFRADAISTMPSVMSRAPDSRAARLKWAARAAWTAGCALGAWVGLSGLSACGPSFQVVYEGDARFEHCYAIDDTPTVSMQEKTDCWTQWVKSYRYGQTRNRIDYAAMRAKALQEAHLMPTDEAVMSAAPGGGTAAPVGVNEPVTTNAFASPPKTLNDGDAGADAVAPSARPNTLGAAAPPATATPGSVTGGAAQNAPAQGCTDRCQTAWRSCHGVCSVPACSSCDAVYRGCMKKCF